MSKRHKASTCKLTAEVRDKIVEAIEKHLTQEAAASLAGISWRTLQTWRSRGQSEESGPFYDLFEAMQHAKAISQRTLVDRLLEAGRHDWRCLAWALERRHVGDFAACSRLQHSIQSTDGPTVINVSFGEPATDTPDD